jgi:hypothetical protein
MKKLIVLVVIVLGVFASSATALDAPTATATQVGPSTFTFDATSNPCPFGCAYSWRYYGANTNRLGATLGNTPVVTFTFPTPGVYAVVLTLGQRCSATSNRSCPGSTQINVVAQ